MRFFILMLVLLPLLASRSTLASSGIPPLDEYNNVAPGMLLQEKGGASQQEKGRNDFSDSVTVMTFEEMLAAYRQKNFDAVAKHIVPLAESGHAQAEELLGVMYRSGQGMPKDPVKAFPWLAKAAESSQPLAQHHLGTMYYTGDGVPADAVKALMWLQIAVAHYPEGPGKTRATEDRDNASAGLTRRDRDRALQMARDWLEKKDEAHLLNAEKEKR